MTLWTPASITTDLWLDASDTSTLTLSGNELTYISDKSGNSRDFNQTTSANRPDSGLSTLNGLNILDFAASCLNSVPAKEVWNFLHNGTTYSIYAAVKFGVIADPNALYGLVGNSKVSSSNDGLSVWFDDRAAQSRNNGAGHVLGAGSILDNYTGNDKIPANTAMVFELVADPSNATPSLRSGICKNGEATFNRNNTRTSAPSTANADFLLQIGALGGDTFKMTGQLGELIITQSLDTTEHDKIVGYMAWKWGLEGNLPSGHPYEFAAPTLPVVPSSSFGPSAGSSGGPIVVLQTVRKIVDMPYSLMESIRNLVNMLYGMKLAAIVNLRYGDLTELRKITYLRYGDLALIRRVIDVLYGDLSSYRNLVNIDYDLMSQVRGLINIPYHILQGEVRNLVNLPYDLQLLDVHKNIIDIIYAIASGEAIEEITSLSVINEDGYELNPFHINIEKDEGDPCIRIEMRSNDENDYVKNPIKKKVTVTVNSDSYIVLVEDVEISTQISEDGQQLEDVYSFKLSSPCMLLDAPYADLLTEELSGMASFIADYVAGTVGDFSPYGIEWNLIDWNIKEKIFTVNDASPISILETLASVCGGILQSKKDGTLELRPEYPTNIPDYGTTSPSVFLTDQDNFYSISSITERYQGYNNFLVGDVSPDVEGLEIKSEQLTSTTREVRVFQVPFNIDDTIQLKTSGGEHVEISEKGVVSILIEDEEIEIVDGEGSVSYPIYSVKDYSYLETDLGDISAEEDKTVSTNVKENSILTISYYTKFRKYVVKDEKIENVQFWPEIV